MYPMGACVGVVSTCEGLSPKQKLSPRTEREAFWRFWLDSWSQVLPLHSDPGGARKAPPALLVGAWTRDTVMLDFRLQDSERIHFCGLRSLGLLQGTGMPPLSLKGSDHHAS